MNPVEKPFQSSDQSGKLIKWQKKKKKKKKKKEKKAHEVKKRKFVKPFGMNRKKLTRTKSKTSLPLIDR